jgi:hypothetical protein
VQGSRRRSEWNVPRPHSRQNQRGIADPHCRWVSGIRALLAIAQAAQILSVRARIGEGLLEPIFLALLRSNSA